MAAPYQSGQIYIVGEEPASGWVKIGWIGANGSKGGILPTRMKDRLSNMQVGNPRRLVILAEFRATREEELQLHDVLANLRGSGEWFQIPQILFDAADDDYWHRLMETVRR